MLKSERGFLAFIAICLLSAGVVWTGMRPDYPNLPSSEYKRANIGKYSPGSPTCLPSHLRSLPDGEAADEQYRCEVQAEEHRLQNDDLVQQTRSANAASAAVDLAYRQMLIELAGGIFGLLTLLAAAYAAWYAKKAAEAGHAANQIAATNHQQALSPYIAVSSASFKIDNNFQPIAHVELKNYGQSPALDVETWFHIWVECFPLHDPLPPAPKDLPKGKSVIGPGGTAEIVHPRGGPLNATEQREILAGGAALYVFGQSTYRDISGNQFCSDFLLFASGDDQVKFRRLSSYIDGNTIRHIARENGSI